MPLQKKVTNLKYPRETKMVNGDFEHRCGRCGEYFPEKEFNRTPFCKECMKFMREMKNNG